MFKLFRTKSQIFFSAALLPLLAVVCNAQVKITIEHNTGRDATAAFKFKTIPSPSATDAGSKASLALIVGRADSDAGPLDVLVNGLLPTSEDDPPANFFFGVNTDGGRFRFDFGNVRDITEVNTYSWHANTRGPQIYNLFASDGTAAGFNPSPDGKTDPRSCGWKLIATVDTVPPAGPKGGQYGVSISDASGSIGHYRYLLFDTIPAEYDDEFGNTFFSEIDVIAK